MPLEPVRRKSVEEFEAMGQHSPGVLSAELNGAMEKHNANRNSIVKIEIDSKDGAPQVFREMRPYQELDWRMFML